MVFNIMAVEDELIDTHFEEINKNLSDFYSMNIDNDLPKIFIIKDRKTFDTLLRKKSELYQVGFIMNKSIFLLDRTSFAKESSHANPTEETYLRILKHETSHLYFTSLSNDSYNPRWLWEGTALYTDGSLHTMIKKPTQFKEFLNFYNSADPHIYSESGFVIEFLIDKFGKGLLLKLIKELRKSKTEEKFLELFKSIYDFNLSYQTINENI